MLLIRSLKDNTQFIKSNGLSSLFHWLSSWSTQSPEDLQSYIDHPVHQKYQVWRPLFKQGIHTLRTAFQQMGMRPEELAEWLNKLLQEAVAPAEIDQALAELVEDLQANLQHGDVFNSILQVARQTLGQKVKKNPELARLDVYHHLIRTAGRQLLGREDAMEKLQAALAYYQRWLAPERYLFLQQLVEQALQSQQFKPALEQLLSEASLAMIAMKEIADKPRPISVTDKNSPSMWKWMIGLLAVLGLSQWRQYADHTLDASFIPVESFINPLTLNLIQGLRLSSQSGDYRHMTTYLPMAAVFMTFPSLAAAVGEIGNEFRVNSYTVGSQESPVIARLADGGFVIVWVSDGQANSAEDIYGKRYAANGTEVVLPTSGMNGAVGNEFPVNSYTELYQTSPQISSLTDGGFVIVWWSHEQDGPGEGGGIYGKRYAANGTEIALPSSGTNGAVGNEFSVNSYTSAYQASPAITTLSDGGFVVVWMSYGQDGARTGIIGKRYAANGTEVALPTSGMYGAVGNEFLVNIYTNDFQRYPAITELEENGFVVVWRSDGQNGVGGIFGRCYAADGTDVQLPTSGKQGAVENEFRVSGNNGAYQYQTPRISRLEDGGFVVVWQTDDSSASGVYGKRYAANGTEIALPTSGTGGAAGNIFPINSYTFANQDSSAICSLTDGGFTVIWHSDSGGLNLGIHLGIRGKRYAANGKEVAMPTSGKNGTVENEFPVSDYTNQGYSSAIIGLADGGFVATWQQSPDDQVSSAEGIYGKRYAADGREVKPPILPTSTSSPTSSPVSTLNDSKLVIGLVTAGGVLAGSALVCSGLAAAGFFAYRKRRQTKAKLASKQPSLADKDDSSIVNPDKSVQPIETQSPNALEMGTRSEEQQVRRETHNTFQPS